MNDTLPPRKLDLSRFSDRPRIVVLTPPGRGAVATVRVEGPGATAVVEKFFHAKGSKPLAVSSPERLHFGHFVTTQPDEAQNDEALHGEEVVVRRYADRDAVEIHCHGGLLAVRIIEQALVAQGCQAMAWHKWTDAHHDDPITAAAHRALADAPTQRTAAILLDQYQGALRRAFDAIDDARRRGDRNSARVQIDQLLALASLGRHLIAPWKIVLAGQPNVGKSSLINALVGYQRAIVHHMPGTTRDAVTATSAVDGWPVEFCDTAGLRSGTSDVERAGVQRAHEQLAQADLAVLVFDGSEPWSDQQASLVASYPQALLVHNKCDLPAHPAPRPEGIALSARMGHGMTTLLDIMASRLVVDPPPPGAAVPFAEEHLAQLTQWRDG